MLVEVASGHDMTVEDQARTLVRQSSAQESPGFSHGEWSSVPGIVAQNVEQACTETTTPPRIERGLDKPVGEAWRWLRGRTEHPLLGSIKSPRPPSSRLQASSADVTVQQRVRSRCSVEASPRTPASPNSKSSRSNNGSRSAYCWNACELDARLASDIHTSGTATASDGLSVRAGAYGSRVTSSLMGS
jgi:hypothetical protein